VKNYLLPTLISLALSTSPWAFAQSVAPDQAETTPPTTETTATPSPAVETPPVVTSTTTVTSSTATTEQSPVTTEQSPATTDQASATPPTAADMMAKRQAFRQQMQKQMEKVHNAKTPEERQQLMEEFEEVMQKHRQEMWGGDSNSPPPYRRGDYDDMRGRGDYAPPPAWGNDMPPYGYGPPRGYYGGDDRPYTGRRGGMSPRGGFSSQQQAHQEAMEQRLENIEKLLTEIVKALPKQPETK